MNRKVDKAVSMARRQSWGTGGFGLKNNVYRDFGGISKLNFTVVYTGEDPSANLSGARPYDAN